MRRVIGKINCLLGLLGSIAVVTSFIIVLPEQGYLAFEEAVSNWIKSLVNERSTPYWKAATWLGSSLFLITATLLASGFIGLIAGFRKAVWLPVFVGVSYGLNLLMKAWINRPRPESAWGVEADGASFPSANAMLALTLFGLIAVIYWQSGGRGRIVKLIVAISAAVIILIVGWSRLYFSVHYAFDIIGGYAAALAIIFGYLLCNKPIKRDSTGKAHSNLEK